MRRKVIAGNWKCNMTPNEASEFANLLKDKVNTTECDVVFCVPFVDIIPVLEIVKDTNIAVGAQNMYYQECGAFTGEIAPNMLTDLGVKYVIIGHSERRAYFGETDDIVNKKVLKALQHKLIPIVCIGESLEQREQGITIDLVRLQTKIAFYGVSAEDAEKIIIAYEPIWAIGTGKTATSQQAEEVCAAIRQVIKEIYSESVAEKIRIQYGGSVNSVNANELFNMENIDGGLVGGASIKAEFEQIVNY